jgi:DNA-directed RNA polymerase subunit K/omega
MVDQVELPETGEPTTDDGAAIPREPAPPIYDRFLYVNVAAMRAKQLRRGALPRLGQPSDETSLPIKPERVAMEEVRRGMVHYEVPAPKVRNAGADVKS